MSRRSIRPWKSLPPAWFIIGIHAAAVSFAASPATQPALPPPVDPATLPQTVPAQPGTLPAPPPVLDPAAERQWRDLENSKREFEVRMLLTQLLDDPDIGMDPARRRLAKLGPDAWQALPIAMAAFRDPDDPRGEFATAVLIEFGDKAMPIVTGVLKEKDPPAIVQRRALMLFERVLLRGVRPEAVYPATELLPDLLAGGKLADVEVLQILRIAQAVGGDADRQRTDLTDEVHRIIAKSTGETRRQALKAYVATRGVSENHLGLLLKMAVSEAPENADSAARRDIAEDRNLALWLIANAGPRADYAAPRLARMLNDPSAKLRGRAAYALASVAPASPEAREGLLTAVRRGDTAVRTLLAPALRSHPEGAEATIAALRQLAEQNDNPAARAEAKAALHQIGPAAAVPAAPATQPGGARE